MMQNDLQSFVQKMAEMQVSLQLLTHDAEHRAVIGAAIRADPYADSRAVVYADTYAEIGADARAVVRADCFAESGAATRHRK